MRDAANGSFPKPKLRFYAASGTAEVDVAKVQTDLRHCACLQFAMDRLRKAVDKATRTSAGKSARYGWLSLYQLLDQ